MLGGVEISTKAALFDEAIYSGPIATDLFGEDRYFTDPEEFWRLQNVAIAEACDKLAASGWRDVVVIPPSERFAEWDYEPCAKAKGKVVGFWDKDPKGNVSVQIKAGSLPAAKEKRLREFLEKLFD